MNAGIQTSVFIFIPIIFSIVILSFIFIIGRSIVVWIKNNQSPRLNIEARIVSKRTNRYNNGDSTSYYVTFEVESKDRMEFRISGAEYGMLAEGDYGILSFQGTRYLGYERS